MHTCISSHGLKRSRRSCPRRVNAGNKNTPSTHHPRRRNVTTLMVGLKKKTVTYAKISPKSGEPQRYSWGTQNKQNKPTSQPINQPASQSTSQPASQSANQSTSQPTRQPTSQPTRQPSSQPTSYPNQPTNGHLFRTVPASFVFLRILLTTTFFSLPAHVTGDVTDNITMTADEANSHSSRCKHRDRLPQSYVGALRRILFGA